jgi:peptidoglycan/xylan/chitin deacetylase (PgdA/CDA1 family)
MGIRSFAASVLVLLLSTSCLGENAPVEDLEAELARYDDKGRTAVDPLTPGVLTLTFDDGPSEFSRDIIDTLTAHRVQGVFFWVGRLMAGRRDVIEHAKKSGQQVASHSYNHEPQPSLTKDQFEDRVKAVKANIGENDSNRLFFRFPFGAANDDQLRWLRDLDIDGKFYRPVGWHLDSEDFDYNTGYPAAPFSKNILDEDRLGGDEGKCNGQANPFQKDFVGWCVFIAHKVTGGVMLFHDTKQITRDKLDEIISGLENPERYWTSLSAVTRAEYTRYYECQKTERFSRFTFRPLHDGLYPSFLD